MWRFIAVSALLLSSVPILTIAQDKEEPARSLADDAAFLAAGGGKSDAVWKSADLSLTKGDDKFRFRGKLGVTFSFEKGQTIGRANFQIDLGKGGGGFAKAFPTKEPNVKLTEKGGKRFITLTTIGDKVHTLEYSIKGTELIVQGGKVSGWAGYSADLTRPRTFRPLTQVESLREEVRDLSAHIRALEDRLAEPEFKKLHGTWKVVAVEGAPGPGGPESMEFVFEAGKLMSKSDKGGSPTRIYIDTSRKPATIDFCLDDVIVRGLGIYELTGDKLKVCFASELVGRPTEFAGTKGKSILLFLERVR